MSSDGAKDMRLGTTAMAEKGPITKNRTKVKHIKQISLMDVAPCSLDVVPETGFELMFDNLPIYFLVRVIVLMAFLLSYKILTGYNKIIKTQVQLLHEQHNCFHVLPILLFLIHCLPCCK